MTVKFEPKPHEIILSPYDRPYSGGYFELPGGVRVDAAEQGRNPTEEALLNQAIIEQFNSEHAAHAASLDELWDIAIQRGLAETWTSTDYGNRYDDDRAAMAVRRGRLSVGPVVLEKTLDQKSW